MKRNNDGFTPAQYLWVGAAMTGVGLISHFFDHSPLQLTSLKVVLVPLLALASYAIDRQFDVDEAYRRWSSTFLERVLTMSFVLAASVTFLIAQPESTMPGLVWTFVCLLLVFAVIASVGPLGKRRPTRGRDEPS